MDHREKDLLTVVLRSFTTYFSISYCLMLIPSQVIMTYVRPSFWLSGLEIGWGVITGLMAIVHSAKQVYALRFFLGLMEASAWPGMMTLLSKLRTAAPIYVYYISFTDISYSSLV